MKRSGRLFYGWIIVAASFLVITIAYGAVFTFGVFLTPLREYFGATTAVISGAYSLAMISYSSFGILTGWVVDKYGPKLTTLLGGLLTGLALLAGSQVNAIWQLYVSYALLGAGMSAGYTPLMPTISRWFTKRRGLAMGIISSGVGVGPLIMAPLASYLIATNGWRFAYLVMASAAIIIIAASFLMKRSPEEIGELPDGRVRNGGITQTKPEANKVTAQIGGLSLKEAIGTKSFWLLAFMYLMVGIGILMILGHVAAYSQGKGLSPIAAAAVLSTITGSSIAGRLVLGVISDRIGRKKALAFCLCGEGVMIFYLIGASSPWMFFLFGAIYGFCYGGHVPQLPALIGETLGLAHMGVLLGAVAFLWGVGGVIGPVLAGRIVDITGSYSGAFIAGAIAMFLAALAVSLVRKAF
ncbi:MFS transporter [Chloroflexota bacterium]